MDTLLNYDPKPNSQFLPENWQNLVPDTYRRISENEKKGDFLAVIGRSHPDERKLNDLIRKWATLDGLKTEEFFLKKLPPYHAPTIEVLQEHAYFWQSDNSRFWFYAEDKDYMSFPAILLTDTGSNFKQTVNFTTQNCGIRHKVGIGGICKKKIHIHNLVLYICTL